MIKQDVKQYTTLYECDGCSAVMIEPLFQRNDGSYQDNFISAQGMHFCHQCGARILKNLVQDNVTRIDLTPYKGAFRHDTIRSKYNIMFENSSNINPEMDQK